MRFHAAFVLSLAAASLITSCSSPDAPQSNAPQADDDLVTVTTVRLRADGSSEQTVKQMTHAQEHAELLALRATPAPVSTGTGIGTASQAISSDTCGAADLWLYDRFDGTGNRICFIGVGVADLSEYLRKACSPRQCINYGTWDMSVRSYRSGEAGGWFTARDRDGGSATDDSSSSEIEVFGYFSPVQNVGRIGASADYVTLPF